MKNRFIILKDSDVQDRALAEVFDQKLREAISQGSRRIAIQLKEEMEPSIELLEWLEKWTKKLTKEKRELIIVPSSPEHLEILNLSHPDQNLKYVSSIEDLDSAFFEEEQEEKTETEEENGVIFLEEIKESKKSAPVQPEPEVETRPLIQVKVDTVSEVSGEYACLGCGAKRMWLKGDTIFSCENPECLDPEAGWQLSCDIF